MLYFLAADPALDPLRGWDGTIKVYESLLSIERDRAGWDYGFRDWYQANQAVTTLPGLALPNVFLICGFLGTYIIAIGPINYYLLRRLKRRELAWLSIPAVVLLFSACAVLIGGLTRGGRPVINRMAIVKTEPGLVTASMDGLVGLFSPGRTSFDLQVSSALVHPMPDIGTGGNDGLTILEEGSQVELRDFQVDLGGIRSFVVSGTAPAWEHSHNLRLVSAGQDARLEGTITNNSLIRLQDAVLLAPGIAHPLGHFAPGETKTISLNLVKSERASATLDPLTISRSFTTAAPPYYYYSSDTTITDIVGTLSYYDDPDNYRRYALVSSVLAGSEGVSGRGGGVYLTGWAGESPLQVTSTGGLLNKFEYVDTTLHIITLEPEVSLEGDALVLGPSFFTWRVLESQYGDVSPYNVYPYAGRYALGFSLAQPVNYSSVKELILHLETMSATRQVLEVSLWNHASGAFEQVEVPGWGDTSIPDPEKYVGPGGEIIMEIDTYQLPSTDQISRSDFSLVVEP
jgi:hypothetical protein